MNLILAITGASGSVYGKRLLEFCKEKEMKTFLIVSSAAKKIISHELDMDIDKLDKMAEERYSNDDIEAPISSGSTKTDGMVIIPSSMKTLGSIANGIADNLITRSADVTLKENRKLVIVPRESPFRTAHIKNMEKLSREGAVILPASPGFYHHPREISDLVDFVVGKVLDQFKIDHGLYETWGD
ncbi:MAG: UbiX family flavin prenyltransferase [Candidatus Hadarchaeota archaeon]